MRIQNEISLSIPDVMVGMLLGKLAVVVGTELYEL
jgi:hypothetical protein